MNTPDSTRVEVNEELLADLVEKASAATWGHWRCWNGWQGSDTLMRALRLGPPEGGGFTAYGNADIIGSRGDFEYVASACPAVVLALVGRIRELESKERQLDAAEDHVRVLEAYIRDPHEGTSADTMEDVGYRPCRKCDARNRGRHADSCRG